MCGMITIKLEDKRSKYSTLVKGGKSREQSGLEWSRVVQSSLVSGVFEWKV
jgi:hypothetical protein